jgi:ATP-binding cassette subfamily B protein
VAEAGTHDELLAAGGAYADLWAVQTGVPVPSGVR